LLAFNGADGQLSRGTMLLLRYGKRNGVTSGGGPDGGTGMVFEISLQ
jgi:hypothetical protein